MDKEYRGSCHCGAITFRFKTPVITKGLRCNCSLCTRKGAMMTMAAVASSDFDYHATEGALGLYQFGLKTAKHYFCKNCGIYTFHETARQPGHYRANLGCLEGVDPFELDYDVFDGRHLL